MPFELIGQLFAQNLVWIEGHDIFAFFLNSMLWTCQVVATFLNFVWYANSINLSGGSDIPKLCVVC
jgi:hypothetical protein